MGTFPLVMSFRFHALHTDSRPLPHSGSTDKTYIYKLGLLSSWEEYGEKQKQKILILFPSRAKQSKSTQQSLFTISAWRAANNNDPVLAVIWRRFMIRNSVMTRLRETRLSHKDVLTHIFPHSLQGIRLVISLSSWLSVSDLHVPPRFVEISAIPFSRSVLGHAYLPHTTHCLLTLPAKRKHSVKAIVFVFIILH